MHAVQTGGLNMPDIKITVWKAVKAAFLFIVGAIISSLLAMPWAALTIGALLVGIENFIRIYLEEKGFSTPKA